MVKIMIHAISVFNEFRDDIIDCGLSKNGIAQASKLKGKYELVIISPLRRSKQTLDFSSIEYDKLVTNNDIREVIRDKCDLLQGEIFVYENDELVEQRCNNFKKKLKELSRSYDSILVISHSDFIWHFTSKIIDGERHGILLDNAEVIEFD